MKAQVMISSSRSEGESVAGRVEAPPCPHVTLVPHWDSVQDMGNREKIVHYICDGCQETFSPAQGGRLRVAAAEALSLPRTHAASDEQGLPKPRRVPIWRRLLRKVWQRSAVVPLSAKLRVRLIEERGLAEQAGASLRMMKESGRFSGRPVTYFRVFDPAAVPTAGVTPCHFGDLAADQILYAGHIESDGEISLKVKASEG